MKHLQKILLALLVWGIAATGNSFAQLPRGVPDAIVSSPTNAVTPDGILPSKPYYFAVRTNMLYDAILLPTLGVEWRVNRDMGIKLDGSFGWWGSNSDKIQKVWFLNPEVRWYLLRDKRFYVGASGSYGEYNIYKPLLEGHRLSGQTVGWGCYSRLSTSPFPSFLDRFQYWSGIYTFGI